MLAITGSVSFGTKIWIPRVYFDNSLDTKGVVVEDLTTVSVQRLGEPGQP